MQAGYVLAPTVNCLHRRCALFVAIASAVTMMDAQAACGPLAAGSYNVSQTCTPAAGLEASITTQPGTTIDTTAGSSILVRASNNNAAVTLSGTTINSNPATAANAVFSNVIGAAGTASLTVDGGINSVNLIGSGLDALAITNASSGSSAFTVTAGTTLNISNVVVGDEHDGIDVSATGGGAISINHNGSGSISTSGGNGIWAKGTGSSNINVNVGNGVSILVDNTNALSGGTPIIDDTLPTAGVGNHAGVHTRATSGNTTVDNAAAITGRGMNAFGIFTEGGTGTTQLHNSGSINTNGLNGFGIRAFSTSGSINVVNDGTITTTGGGGHGIYANDNVGSTGSISIENNATLNVGSLSDIVGSRAIYVIKRGIGDTTITGNGNINVLGGLTTTRAYGILISAESGTSTVNYGGDISVSGAAAGGIRVDSTAGNVRVDYTGNRIETFNGNANGIFASTQSTTGTVDVNARGTITTHSNTGGGDGTGIGSFGIQVLSQGGNINVAYGGPRIDVNGSGAAIVAGNAFGSGTGLGSVNISNTGELIARGNLQQGIRTFSTTGQQTVTNTGAIQTSGASDSQGIRAEASGAASIAVNNTGAITAKGTGSSGIDAQTLGGSVTVSNSAAVQGGWADSSGVTLAGATQTLNNTGSIVALSDSAVRADTNGPGSTFTLNNAGQMTGSVTADGSVSTVTNQGTWTLRNFADSTGSGTRDTWGIAVSNLGTAVGNSIDNTGLIRLANQPATGISNFTASGAYLPLGQTANQPTLGGAVQGQILGVSSFTHSGTLDLAAGSRTVGNVLVISGATTAGADGGGVFVSNGGSLLLNTTLNEGAANSLSDMLVVDSTSSGSGGPTAIAVTNVGGLGELTQGNGIAVVELTNKAATASNANAFQLARRVVAGPYEYRLQQGAEDGTGKDTWYLRSDERPPDGPPGPEPGPAPGPAPAPVPNYRPEVSLYGALPALALVYGRTMVDTLHERVGEERLNPGEPLPTQDQTTNGPSMGWGRVIYRSGKQDGDRKNALGDTPQYNYDLTAFQVGTDLYRKVRTDGSHEQAGVSLSAGTIDAGVSHYTGSAAGEDTLRAYGIGAYWTHFGPSGWYLDGVLQLNHFDIEAKPNGLSKLETKGWGYTASLENGYPYEVDKNWYVEPQLQAIYSYVDLDSSDDVGANVRFKDVESLVGRLGVRVARDWDTEGTDKTARRTNGWIRPSIWHEFKGQPKTEFSSQSGYVPFESDIQGTWGEVNLGVDYQANQRTTFTVSAGYRQGFDGDSHGYDAMVGFKIAF
ncbi:autotransporter outer membrane beta-barrel domain-containing protein [Pseudomonas sp. SWRI74]|uniref:Autotransporter outer membrane beta-barrel domain-containing protein n=1 Tax=Pseudomonas azerbaijanoccidentalis TaxID=2842347 RepID=A0ABS6QT86_9PSED|nr:autotransporter outer membrane beta-barrel domain-containing protein [Pseudomonas azerbaijanoccidentalis]MBV4522074.1 autotransporter outer membrane beta-barrel domain-containing protein [Pseudomonas azerbaijanoccidentalis]